MALAGFVEVALADSPVRVDVVEEPATYGETLAAARAASATNQLLLVPSTVGAVLVDEGASRIERLFEDDDPDMAATQLGVWLLEPGGGVAPASADRSDTGGVLPIALAQGSNNDSVDVGSEVGSLLRDEAGAIVSSKEQTLALEAAAGAVEAYGARAGASVAVRGVAKVAGPVAAVADFLITMRDFTIAAMEMIDAEGAAASSAVDLGYTAVGMLSNATVRLCGLESAIIDGSLPPAAAREAINVLSSGGERTARVGEAALTELEGLGDEVAAAQIGQLIESRRIRLQSKVLMMLDLVAERESRSVVSLGSGSENLDELVGTLAGANLDEVMSQAMLEVFTDAPVGNEALHSDGVKKVLSAGNTDIIRTGQFWYSTAEPGEGSGLDELFPCGAAVLCDEVPRDRGLFTVFTVEFDGDLPMGPTGLLYQYGIVADRNGDVADNYRASDAYLADTFDNTDIWYQVEGGPEGLKFSVTDARTFGPIMSGSRVLFDGPLMALITPQDEIGGGPDAPAVRWRATSFSHSGDFGEVEPFNIDAFPIVGEPLMVPPEIVKIDGGGVGPPSPGPLDPAIADRLDAVGAGIGSDLSGFTSVAPARLDPSALAEVPACWASREMLGDVSILGVRRYAFERDGVTIEVRLQLHDSDSAARGASGFRLGGVNTACRETLISQIDGVSGVRSAPPDPSVPFAVSGVIVTDFTANGVGQQAASGSYFDGDMSMSFTAVSPGDTAPFVDAILGTSAFAAVP